MRYIGNVGGWFYVLLSTLNVATCMTFLAFSVECSIAHASPVELCYDSFLAYREVNKAMLGLLFGALPPFVSPILLLLLTARARRADGRVQASRSCAAASCCGCAAA